MVVLTGRNRVRGTWIARAPSIRTTAPPMAVSIWMTSVDDGSEGSTVFRLTITGSPIPASPRDALSFSSRSRACRSTQRLFAWKVVWSV